jgi:hypothetical protein
MHLESVPGCAGAVGRRAVGGLGGGKGKGGRENGFGRTGTVRTTFWPGVKGSARVRLVAASFRRSQTDATFAPASDGRRPTLHLPRLPTVADRCYICPGFRRSQTDATFAPASDGRRPTLHFDSSTAAPWGEGRLRRGPLVPAPLGNERGEAGASGRGSGGLSVGRSSRADLTQRTQRPIPWFSHAIVRLDFASGSLPCPPGSDVSMPGRALGASGEGTGIPGDDCREGSRPARSLCKAGMGVHAFGVGAGHRSAGMLGCLCGRKTAGGVSSSTYLQAG